MPSDFQKFLGERIREFREERSLRQEDLARAAKELGLDWRRETVANIERGQRRVTVPEFLLLPVILRRKLVDLFPEAASFALTSSTSSTGAAVRRILAGTALDSSDLGVLESSREAGDRPCGSVFDYKRLWPAVTDDRIDEIESAARGMAEQKLAARLHCHPNELSALAFRLWGRGFSDERERRLARDIADRPTSSPRSQQALRGHISRALRDEIEPVGLDVGVCSRK